MMLPVVQMPYAQHDATQHIMCCSGGIHDSRVAQLCRLVVLARKCCTYTQYPTFCIAERLAMIMEACNSLQSPWQAAGAIIQHVTRLAESCSTSCMAILVTLDHSHNPAIPARIAKISVANRRDSSGSFTSPCVVAVSLRRC